MNDDLMNTLGIIIIIVAIIITIGLVIVGIAALVGWGLKLGGLMNFGIIQGFIASFPL